MAALALGLGGSLLGGSLFGSMGAQIGMLGASVLGQFLFPQKRTENRLKLSDMKVSSSTYGKGITKVWGTMRVAGNVFWALDIEERDVNAGKKGGSFGLSKKDKPPEYYGHFAVGLCEGVVERILRVWADSNIIYDVLDPKRANRVGFQGNEAHRGYDPDRRDRVTTGKGAKKAYNTHTRAGTTFQFRTYLGTEAQLPDRFMQSHSGAHRTPAHRGLCYLFFEDLPLEDFGNRLPSITVELVRKRTDNLMIESFAHLDEYNGNPWYHTLQDDAVYDPVNRMIVNRATTWDGVRIVDRALRIWDVDNLTEVKPSGGFDLFGLDLSADQYGDYPPTNRPMRAFYNLIGATGQGHVVLTGGNSFYGAGNYQILYTFDPKLRAIRGIWGSTRAPLDGGDVICYANPRIWGPVRAQYVLQLLDRQTGMPETYHSLQIFTYSRSSAWFATSKRGLGMLGYIIRHYDGKYNGGAVTRVDSQSGETTAFYVFYANQGSKIWRVEYDMSSQVPFIIGDTTCALETGGYSGTDNYKVYANGYWYAGQQSIPQEFGVVTNEIHSMFYFARSARLYALCARMNYGFDGEGTFLLHIDDDGQIVWEKKISPKVMSGNLLRTHTDIITGSRYAFVFQRELFIFDDQSQEIHSRQLPARVPFPTNWQFFDTRIEAIYFWSSGADAVPPAEPTWYVIYLDRSLRNGMTLEQIVREIAYDRGLHPAQLETSELTDVVTGYMMEEPQTGRALIEQLAKVFHFDVVESDYVLKFPKRGKAIIRTINEDEMVAIDEERNDAYRETRTQDVDLPERVIVNYVDPVRDYMTTTQHAKRHRSSLPTMQSRESIDVNLPMSLTAAQAKQMAEKVLFASWIERIGYELKLPWKHLDLDPSDAVRFHLDNGWLFETRFLSSDLGADYAIEIDAVLQDGQSYFSDSPGSIVDKIGTGEVVPRPTVSLTIRDVPLLNDADHTNPHSGVVYVFAQAQGPGFKPGPSYKWVQNRSQPESAGFHRFSTAWGVLLDPLSAPKNGHLAIDEAGSIRFRPGPITFDWETINNNLFIAGNNAILVDNELIYFRDASVSDDGIVTISCLLRGMRGTSVFGFSHLEGAEIVYVDGGVVHDTIALADIGNTASYLFGGPRFAYQNAANIEKIVYEGNSFRPLPVVAFDWRHFVTDVSVYDYRWRRQSRIGGTLTDGDDEPPLIDPEEYDFFILKNVGPAVAFDPNNDLTYAFFERVNSPCIRLTLASPTEINDLDLSLPYEVVVYQRSNVIGRGFAARFSVDPPPLRGTLFEDPEFIPEPVPLLAPWGQAQA